MHNCTETQAVCRGCGLKLRGSPSWKGGLAYHPEPKGEVHQCHYGGWVCSRRCDIRACVELEGTMPGCGGVNGYERLSKWTKSEAEFHSNGTYLGNYEYDSGASWSSWDGGFCDDDEPTHWQPLPAPPTK